MQITGLVPQLRTTNLAASIEFYTTKLSMILAFRYGDFYAGIRAGTQIFHLKLVDTLDPSIGFVRAGDHFHLYFDIDDVDGFAAMARSNDVQLLQDVHDTSWGTREFSLADDQGHTLYFGRRCA